MTVRDAEFERRARQVIENALSPIGQDLPKGTVNQVVALVSQEVTRERERCHRLCLHRAELWERTASAQPSAPEHAREESLFRRNEARYLADLISSEADLYGDADA